MDMMAARTLHEPTKDEAGGVAPPPKRSRREQPPNRTSIPSKAFDFKRFLRNVDLLGTPAEPCLEMTGQLAR
jgi:hypothetical protein